MGGLFGGVRPCNRLFYTENVHCELFYEEMGP